MDDDSLAERWPLTRERDERLSLGESETTAAVSALWTRRMTAWLGACSDVRDRAWRQP